ncbi:MAG TPA: hypothetical protein VE981_06540 [Planctomycetota bacterium]|nr:hypothetical protein [Planctomycetota bacterium]
MVFLARILLIVFAVLLVLVGGIVWRLWRGVQTTLAWHVADVARILDGVPDRTCSRPALSGPEEPGNSWDLMRPSFEALWQLHPVYGSDSHFGTTMEPDFDAHGIPADTPRLLGESMPWLESCRRATRRTRLDWPGFPDPLWPCKAIRIGRALTSTAFVSWQEGRDADAVEWLTTALMVAHDTARLGQPGTWDQMRVVEAWVRQDLRSMLEAHGLTEPQLVEFERRLDLLRSTRPAVSVVFRTWGAESRRAVLEHSASVSLLNGDDVHHALEETVGWRDLFSMRVCTARVLNGIRDGCERAGTLPMTSVTIPAAFDLEIRAPYRKEDVAQLLFSEFGTLEALEEELQNWDFLRAAIAVARYELVHGRMPATFSECGVPLVLAPRLGIEEDRLSIAGSLEKWTIQRRK